MRGKILIVDDDASMCQVLEDSLGSKGFQVVYRTAAEEAFLLLLNEKFDVVVTDLNMRGMNGIGLCERITANHPDLAVIVITAFGSLDTAVAAIRAGAYDFITKPFEVEALALTLDRAIQLGMLKEEVKRLRLAVGESSQVEGIIGEAPPMKALCDLVARAAGSDATILISGETGVGKELIARALHGQSPRRANPFIAINCAAMPALLLESELFGHVRGAFTDAKTSRTGLLLKASGGTLFLDEVGDMPLELQPKILRALQERSVRPVGSDAEVPIDVRIIAATNHDLESAVEEGRFREDLFFRLNVIHIPVPPLRARGNDILLLAQYFVGSYSARSGKKVRGFSSAVAAKLLDYSWPGNVRELQNCIERGVALTGFEEITVEDLPEKIRNYAPSRVVPAGNGPADLVSLEEVERAYIQRVLEAVGGNKSTAARILGLDRKTLYRKLEQRPPGSTPDSGAG